VLALGIFGYPQPSSARSRSSAAGSEAATITATVRSVNAEARTLEVVTGVGYALAVVKLSYEAGAEARTAAGTAPLAQLKPGDLVRIEYTRGAGVNTAKTIAVLPRPESGASR
jgi:hypothetical protein